MNEAQQSIRYSIVVSGVQLLALGLLAEMQVRYYYESRSRSATNDGVSILRAESQPPANSPGQPSATP
ncbi:MAG TPA: hypothetical protein VGR03_08890 [Candidatus Acidoferrum sp.]|nr:hypothetical protein [Candidatus Acidoferrum sp.]